MKVPDHVTKSAKKLLRGEIGLREYFEEIDSFQRDVGDGRLLVALGAAAAHPPSQIQLRYIGLIGEGYTDEQIARREEVSKETVKTELKLAYSWLGAKNRAHAVAISMRLGYTT